MAIEHLHFNLGGLMSSSTQKEMLSPKLPAREDAEETGLKIAGVVHDVQYWRAHAGIAYDLFGNRSALRAAANAAEEATTAWMQPALLILDFEQFIPHD